MVIDYRCTHDNNMNWTNAVKTPLSKYQPFDIRFIMSTCDVTKLMLIFYEDPGTK